MVSESSSAKVFQENVVKLVIFKKKFYGVIFCQLVKVFQLRSLKFGIKHVFTIDLRSAVSLIVLMLYITGVII